MPAYFTIPDPGIPAPPKLSDENSLYGRDLAFDGDFTATPALDWKTVEGPDALRQSVYRRLLTLPGEYRPYQDYGAGVRAWVKKQKTTSDLAELRNHITDQLLRDPRITSVLEVRIEDVADNPAMLRVFVRVLALGNEKRYGPFDFTEESV